MLKTFTEGIIHLTHDLKKNKIKFLFWGLTFFLLQHDFSHQSQLLAEFWWRHIQYVLVKKTLYHYEGFWKPLTFHLPWVDGGKQTHMKNVIFMFDG